MIQPLPTSTTFLVLFLVAIFTFDSLVEMANCWNLNTSPTAIRRHRALATFSSCTATTTLLHKNIYSRRNKYSSVSLAAAAKEREGFVKVSRRFGTVADPTEEGDTDTHEYDLHYKIVRPMNLSSQMAAPLVVLHGGPGVPSDYLYPLADVVGDPTPYRSVVFYDQLGCGRSEEPTDPRCYSIALALDDLDFLLKKLNLKQFHLYGQSFGGILAYEYTKRVAEREGSRPSGNGSSAPKCLSIILSSTPTEVKMVEQDVNEILARLREEDDDESTLAERFRLECQCRIASYPEPLKAAYGHAGSVWKGTAAIPDYVAHPPTKNAKRMPSALVMRGEFDFVSSECICGWKSTLFNHKFVREKILKACSHHALLENGAAYGEIVESFCSEYD